MMTRFDEPYKEVMSLFVSVVQFWTKVAKPLYFLHIQSLNMGSAGVVVTLDTMSLIAEANLAGIDNKSLFHNK